MLNVTFYENTITDSNAPKKTGECHLETLKNGSGMFYDCTSLTSFNSDLSSLENGYKMFYGTPLTSFNSDLPSLTNGELMFGDCTSLTSFNSDLSSLTDGEKMFYKSTLESFNSDLSSLTDCYRMFMNCTSLTSFDSDLSSLTNGYEMFRNCTSLESFNSDLSSLTNGTWMFTGCTKLTSFNSDLSSMTSGERMFYQSAIASFNGDLSSLICGTYMFYKSALESFNGDLSSLIYGYAMFYQSTLTSFNGDLSSLICGRGMFQGCKLDPQSVMIIAKSIRDITTEKASLTSSDYVTRTGSGTIANPYIYSKPFGWMSDGSYVYTYKNPKPYTTAISKSDVERLAIGINVTNDSSTIATQLQEFAEAAYYDSWDALKAEFTNKGWTVTWLYGGTNNSITLNELYGQTNSLPIWAKLSEATEENGNYCTEDGSKYYNIEWGHDVNDELKDSTNTDESKFFLFGSLLEACGYFGVIPKEYVENQ